MATGPIETHLHRSFNWENGAPGPQEGPRGRSANCGNGLFAQCVRLRSEINRIDPNSLSPLHFNHLYTVRNENYDILDVLARADTYFDLINHFKFATYLMIHRDGKSIEDIFEMCRDRDAFAVAESYTATLDQAGVYYAVSCFEIDRLAIVRREERAQDVLFYRYPVQKLYQLFIETMNISGFESVANTPTKIAVRSAK